MYYSHKCSYCTKVFYTYSRHKQTAARVLYMGIKKHLIDYQEDHKEYEFDESPSVEANQMYYAMSESTHPPRSGYEVK